MRFALLLLITFSFNFGLTSVQAADFKVPTLSGPVVDEANMLSPSFKKELTEALYKLRGLGEGDVFEIAVLTVPNLGGLPIEQASIQVTDKWKLGGAKGDFGLLLMIAKQERKIRIEVGQGLEGSITDAFSMRVIDKMTPFFKSGQIDEGILVGVMSLAQKALPDKDLSAVFGSQTVQEENPDHRSGFGLLPFIFFFFLIILGGTGGPRGLLAALLLGSMGGGGRRGGGGGFGGGSFGGGGGGFSGGGASGGW